jgi:hypothetical protein
VAQTRLRKLEAEATHAKQRVDLYRAQAEGSRPTSPDRLKKLERLSDVAESRLLEARSPQPSPDQGGSE